MKIPNELTNWLIQLKKHDKEDILPTSSLKPYNGKHSWIIINRLKVFQSENKFVSNTNTIRRDNFGYGDGIFAAMKKMFLHKCCHRWILACLLYLGKTGDRSNVIFNQLKITQTAQNS